MNAPVPNGGENVIEPTESQKGDAVDTSIPDGAVSLESILCTEELHRRPSRPPDYEKENRALVALAKVLADSPRTILQTLADTILEVCQADSAGLSLLTTADGGKRFYWPAIAGRWKPHIGGGTPRDFGPCGDVLDRNIPLLFRHFERRYTYFQPVTPPVEECLLVPFYVEGKAVGTIWAIAHDARRKFDAEDERLMSSLGKFASSAYQILASLDGLEFQVAEREKAEAALRRDIAEQKQVEQALGERARLFDLSNDAIFVRDTADRVAYWNNGALELYGYTREEALGCVSHELLRTEFPEPLERINEQVHRDNRWTGELVHTRKDGGQIVVASRWLLDRDAHGNPESVLETNNDITRQKESEKALRESEERLRTLADGLETQVRVRTQELELPEIVLGGGLRVRKIVQELEPVRGTLTLTVIALLLGALQAFVGRYVMNPDGISYLDMGEALVRRDWHTAVNGWWSPLYPAILGVALRILRPSAYWEFPCVHFVNFVIYAATLCSFLYFWRAVRDSQRGRSISWPVPNNLEEWPWTLLGYSLFVWASLELITLDLVTPDLCVAAFVFIASALVISIHSGNTDWSRFALLGLALGLGYLAKAPMFPLGFVFLGVGLFSVGDLRKAIPRILLATIVFLAISAPWIAALSWTKGRLTFGDSGTLNYLWFVDGTVQRPAEGELPVDSTLPHSPRKIFQHPSVYQFAGPFKTSFPYWYDVSYWMEGLKPHFRLPRQLRALLNNSSLYLEMFLSGQRAWAAVALLSLFMIPARWPAVRNILSNWHLLLPAAAAFLMYGLVYVEVRHVAAFFVLFWTATFLGLYGSNSAGSPRVFIPLTLALAILMSASVALKTGSSAWKLRDAGFPSWEVVKGLQEIGVKPGDQVACVGWTFDAYWTRLARVSIVAEIPHAPEFWGADPSVKAQAIGAIALTGAKVIVAVGAPPDLPFGWRRIGKGSPVVYVLAK
jgi:PAS domain S-box-containing protein